MAQESNSKAISSRSVFHDVNNVISFRPLHRSQGRTRESVKTIGAHGPRLEEPLGWVKTYPIQWREPRIDLAELAKLRWIEGWTRADLAKRYGKTDSAIQNYIQYLKRRDFCGVGLSAKEIKIVNKTVGG